jgi:general secretion pathway protein M
MIRNLSKREKYAVFGTAGLIGLIIIFQFIVSPMIASRERMDRSLSERIKIRDNVFKIKAEYEAIKKRAAESNLRFAQRRADFTLFSFLDSLAGEAEIKDHISYMKPSTSSPKDSPYKISQVEMKLKDITMEQLATYLYKVDTSKNMVYVKRLSISKDSKEIGFIDATLQVETPEI